MSTAAVVTAAGYGTRLGSTVPKALVTIRDRPLLVWALEHVAPIVTDIVVTAPPTHIREIEQALALGDQDYSGARVRVVAGGTTRQASVALGLDALFDGQRAEPEVILVHDAARAFMPTAVMRTAVAAVRDGADGAVPVVPVVDTLVAASGANGEMGDSVDRTTVRAVQTPQVFAASSLRDAHVRGAGSDHTDDASLARSFGYRIVAVDGHRWGFKVTHPDDVPLAEHVAKQCEEQR